MISIDDVAKDLALPSACQDWGIIYADPSRLTEFVEYAISHFANMDAGAKAEILDLVFASVEQDDVDLDLSEPNRVRFAALVAIAIQERDVLNYWRSYLEKRNFHSSSRSLGNIIDAALQGRHSA